MISELEQKIIGLLPTLSEEAKRKARFVLGQKPVPVNPKKRDNLFDEERANLLLSRYLK